MNDGKPVAGVVARMRQRLDDLPAELTHRRIFLGTYLRTTQAVGDAIDRARFEDPAWVEDWDVKFAELYLQAHDADLAGRPAAKVAGDERRIPVARPWRLAFDAPPDLPALRHVLLGMNAHVNYDLPQAIVAVISDEQFDDPALIACRESDHRAIDGVLASRVAAEDEELASLSGPVPLLDRLLAPLNRLGTQRFLREARQKVWANATALSQARRQGPDDYARVLAQLEELSAAKVTQLQAPGQVILKLAATGFGVRLPAAQ